jgi:hypothetical protein
MSVSAKLLLKPSIGVGKVKRALKALGHKDVKCEPTTIPSYYKLYFTVGDQKRSIDFFYNLTQYHFDSVNMADMYSDETNIRILRQLAKMLGGLFQEQDVNSDWEMHETPGQDDLRYLVESYFVNTPNPPIDLKEQLKELVKYSER